MGIDELSAAQRDAQQAELRKQELEREYADLKSRFIQSLPAIEEKVKSSKILRDLCLEWHFAAGAPPKPSLESGIIASISLVGLSLALTIKIPDVRILEDAGGNLVLKFSSSVSYAGGGASRRGALLVEKVGLPLLFMVGSPLLDHHPKHRPVHEASCAFLEGDYRFFWRGEIDNDRLVSFIIQILQGEPPASNFSFDPEPQKPQKDKCFVATEVFGETALETNYFRLFRDEVLEGSRFGRSFVAAYYKISPYIARALRRYIALQPAVRFSLNLLRLLIAAIWSRKPGSDG